MTLMAALMMMNRFCLLQIVNLHSVWRASIFIEPLFLNVDERCCDEFVVSICSDGFCFRVVFGAFWMFGRRG